VLNLIEEQTRKVEQRIDALLLVGGFSGSEYLFKRVDVRPSSVHPVIRFNTIHRKHSDHASRSSRVPLTPILRLVVVPLNTVSQDGHWSHPSLPLKVISCASSSQRKRKTGRGVRLTSERTTPVSTFVRTGQWKRDSRAKSDNFSMIPCDSGYSILSPKARFCGKGNVCEPSSASSQQILRTAFSSLFSTRPTQTKSCDIPMKVKRSNSVGGLWILEHSRASSNTRTTPSPVVSTLVSPHIIIPSSPISRK